MNARVLLLGLAVLAFVGAGYYCAENPKGLLDEPFDRIGYFITFPGQAVVTGVRGNIHASFGDWRDPLIKIGVSYVIWMIPAVLVFRSLSRTRNKPDNEPVSRTKV